MVETDLTFSLSMANMLMADSKDNRSLNSEPVPNLVPNWGRLYQMTQLSDEQFETGLEEGWFESSPALLQVLLPPPFRI